MNTHHLQDILDSDAFARRLSLTLVLACDQLPACLAADKASGFIINLDKQVEIGSHWVSLFYNGLGQFTYFDSFGFGPLSSEIVEFIKNNSTRPLLYNTRHLQTIVSKTCGLYAVYFILAKARGFSLQRVLYPFSNSAQRQYLNDIIILRIVKRLTKRSDLDVLFQDG